MSQKQGAPTAAALARAVVERQLEAQAAACTLHSLAINSDGMSTFDQFQFYFLYVREIFFPLVLNNPYPMSN